MLHTHYAAFLCTIPTSITRVNEKATIYLTWSGTYLMHLSPADQSADSQPIMHVLKCSCLCTEDIREPTTHITELVNILRLFGKHASICVCPLPHGQPPHGSLIHVDRCDKGWW